MQDGQLPLLKYNSECLKFFQSYIGINKGQEQPQSDLDTKNSTFPRQDVLHPDQENTHFDLILLQKSRQPNRRAETDMHFEMNRGFIGCI